MSTNTAAGAERPRPKRRAIPKAVKRIVARRQLYLCKRCGVRAIHEETGTETHWDHEPALRLRAVAPDGLDYDPPQHSADHIDALCPPCHHAKTHGTGASTAGTDAGKIKKERRRRKALASDKPKRKWGGRKLCSKGTFQNQKGRHKWQKRPLRGINSRPSSIASRGFPKKKPR